MKEAHIEYYSVVHTHNENSKTNTDRPICKRLARNIEKITKRTSTASISHFEATRDERYL